MITTLAPFACAQKCYSLSHGLLVIPNHAITMHLHQPVSHFRTVCWNHEPSFMNPQSWVLKHEASIMSHWWMLNGVWWMMINEWCMMNYILKLLSTFVPFACAQKYYLLSHGLLVIPNHAITMHLHQHVSHFRTILWNHESWIMTIHDEWWMVDDDWWMMTDEWWMRINEWWMMND